MESLLHLDPAVEAGLTAAARLRLLRHEALWAVAELPPEGEAAAERLSHRIDALLGLRPLHSEAARAATRRGVATALGEASHSRPWASAETVALLSTPYRTLEAVFQAVAPAPGAQVVDLGAGYGRVGFYLALRWPQVGFLGYEVVAARVAAAQRAAEALGLVQLRFVQQDLAEVALPAADVYFMYQPVNDQTQARLLSQLAALSRARPLVLVACSDPLQEELLTTAPWLHRTALLRTGTTSRRVVGIFQS